MAKNSKTFEESVSRLEEIVRTLEGGSVSLDESLKIYKEGIELVRYCNLKLDDVEKKVKLLSVTTSGEVVEKDFEENE